MAAEPKVLRTYVTKEGKKPFETCRRRTKRRSRSERACKHKQAYFPPGALGLGAVSPVLPSLTRSNRARMRAL